MGGLVQLIPTYCMMLIGSLALMGFLLTVLFKRCYYEVVMLNILLVDILLIGLVVCQLSLQHFILSV